MYMAESVSLPAPKRNSPRQAALTSVSTATGTPSLRFSSSSSGKSFQSVLGVFLYRPVSFTSVIQIDGAESTDPKRVNRVLPEKISSFRQCLLRPPRSDYTSVFRFIEFIQHRTDKLCSACLYGTYQHLRHSSHLIYSYIIILYRAGS